MGCRFLLSMLITQLLWVYNKLGNLGLPVLPVLGLCIAVLLSFLLVFQYFVLSWLPFSALFEPSSRHTSQPSPPILDPLQDGKIAMRVARCPWFVA
jgi:hypothetical protein